MRVASARFLLILFVFPFRVIKFVWLGARAGGETQGLVDPGFSDGREDGKKG